MALTKVGKEGITGIDNSSDATAITITSAENVGIGDSSPDDKLTVYGGLARIGTGDSNHIRMGRNTSSGDFEMQRTLSGVTNQVFLKVKEANNGNIILNEGGGNVMIGTTTEGDVSADDLTIASSGNTGITIRAGTSNSSSIYMSDATSGTGEYAGYIAYSHNTNSMTFGTSSATAMQIYTNGMITKPLQPAFCVNPSAVQYNNAVGSTVTITLDNERFDNNADFASNTFTAPVTGRYQFQAMMRYDDPDRDADYHQLILNTSNQVYVTTYDLGPLAGDPNYWMFYINVTVDMDASDTAYLQFYQYAGAATTDIATNSFFSGHLVC